MAINYKLRDEIKYLILCLYDPSEPAEETQYTFSSVWDYILDCGWQLEHGEKVKRFPYHITPALADAERAKEEFKAMISMIRKDRVSSDENLRKPSALSSDCSVLSSDCSVNRTADFTDDAADPTADHAFIRRSIPRGDICTAAESVVTSSSIRKKQKGFR